MAGRQKAAELWDPIAIEVIFAAHIDRMRVAAERSLSGERM